MSYRTLVVLLFVGLALVAMPAAAVPTELTPTPAPVPPVASFSAAPTSGPAPLAVSFSDTSTGGPTGWAWYFGDEAYAAAGFSRLTESAAWPGRIGQACAVLPDGSLVLTSGGYMTDVWRSTDRGATWTRQTDAAPWAGRRFHASVALPDGSLLVMGGFSWPSPLNDIWRSTNGGKDWSPVSPASVWSPRQMMGAVALPDGSVVVTGGAGAGDARYNDTWRSTDRGLSWTCVNASSGWAPRAGHAAVALPDGSIVVFGGSGGRSDQWWTDAWRSADAGATWTRMTANAPWPVREDPAAVALPDGSILLTGGYYYPTYYNDLWRSTDAGATWTLLGNGAWAPREAQSGCVLPDGSVVLVGGFSTPETYWRDVWRLETASSTARDPSHVYAAPGAYTVALRASNAAGFSDAIRTGYVTVTTVLAVPPSALPPTDPDGDGVYDDVNGNGRPDFADVVLYFNGMAWIAANEPVSAFDFNGNGRIDFADVVRLFDHL